MKVSTGEKEMSTTMALVRMLTNLLRDKNVAPKLVPIMKDKNMNQKTLLNFLHIKKKKVDKF